MRNEGMYADDVVRICQTAALTLLLLGWWQQRSEVDKCVPGKIRTSNNCFEGSSDIHFTTRTFRFRSYYLKQGIMANSKSL